MDGSRSAAHERWPTRRSASVSPTVVVVFPSPAGVGEIAVTRTSLPSGRSASDAMYPRSILALSWP